MDISEMDSFGDLLKWFRNRSKLTQEALAYKIGKQSRGSIQAWENGSLPGDRETVLDLARALRLSESEADKFLLAAHFPQQYHTQGMPVSTTEMGARLELVDIYIYEKGIVPLIDITLHNRGTTSALPTQVQVEILDVGEFYYCEEDEEEDDPTRFLLDVSGEYDLKLSPALKGKYVSVKIAYQLRPDEADRFQVRVGHDFISSRLAYVWYHLKIRILCSDPKHTVEANPILLSVPPVDGRDVIDVWSSSSTVCSEQNRATLRRMEKIAASRSGSVEATIRQILGE